MTAQETVRLIRERFPEPKKWGHYPEGGYCVGGACQAYWQPWLAVRFPVAGSLADTLFTLNRLGGDSSVDHYDRCLSVAGAIIAANDRGDFEAAWAALEEALAYGETT